MREDEVGDISALKDPLRKLTYYSENFGHRGISSFVAILTSIARTLNIDGYNFDIVVKFYEETHTTQIPKEFYTWIDAKESVGAAQREQVNPLYSSKNRIIQALSGVIRTHFWPSHRYFFPTIDLDVPTENEESFSYMIEVLKRNGLSGHILESGSGYHYFGNFIMKYGSLYWKFLGYVLKNLIDERIQSEEAITNIYLAKDIGETLMHLEDHTKIPEQASYILQAFPPLLGRKVRPGLLVDPRWVAHCMRTTELGIMVNALRVNSAKGYMTSPSLIGNIY